ncbi:MAG: hypothetical protein ACFFD2_12455 [Promethearchaeota archaeon]
MRRDPSFYKWFLQILLYIRFFFLKYDDSVKIYEAKVKIETIGVEKANTIAIYETNGTVFNGHYQEQERMNVIQLYVNDSGSGTPFEEGLNTIVIPTSLFTETVFNARVQNETLSETPIYSDDEEIFKFISVGRDGNTEQACEEIDFIIIRFDISSEDAMEVLNLLLECLVNETTNETAIVYSYVSTKENGTAAVLMNLPFSVLGLIPWYCDFSDSPMGSKPETFEDWLWKPLKTLGKAIVGFILFMGMPIIMLVGLIIEFVADILMEWLPIFEYILWLIIRVAILIFACILLAITLFTVIISNLIIGTMLLLIMLSLGGSVKFGLFFYELNILNNVFRMETVIKWIYIDCLCLNFPYLIEIVKLNNTIIQETKTGIIDSSTHEKFYNYNSEVQSSGTNSSSYPITTNSFFEDSSYLIEEELLSQSSTNSPELLNPNEEGDHLFYPMSGTSSIKYTFKVIYKDIEGDEPQFVNLILIPPEHNDTEISIEMYTKDSTPNFTEGVLFECTISEKDGILTLPGLWHFKFYTKDIDGDQCLLTSSQNLPFEGPQIILNIDSFDTMFSYTTIFCGYLPLSIFWAAGMLSRANKPEYASLAAIFGMGAGIGGLAFINYMLFDGGAKPMYGDISYIPIHKFWLGDGSKIKLDLFSAYLGIGLSCLLIAGSLYLVTSHKHGWTGFMKHIITIFATWIGTDFISVALAILNDKLLKIDWLDYILTSLGFITALFGVLTLTIIMATSIYGKEFIHRAKSTHEMSKGFLCKPPNLVAKIPRWYSKIMFIISLVFFVLAGSMVISKFN